MRVGFRFSWMALTAGLLAGCTNIAAEQATLARTSLTGMPKETLLSCAGVPDRQASAGGAEFFTYSSHRLVSYPSSSFGYGPWPYGYGWDWPRYDVASLDCEATFTLRNGVVERLVYGGGNQASQCFSIVRNCLAIAPQPQVR